ncbi:MAG: helix-turn-helix domain-containing protein [Pirellulales bacterium]
MAGKFLSLEEAARHLGVTIEEINRLVDRKKLFPMRDGPTVKFKLDELDRVAADADDEPAASSDLSLDLGLSSPALGGPAGGAGITLGDDDIVLGDAIEESESIFGSGIAGGEMPSRTIVRGNGDAHGGDAAVGGEDLVIGDAGSALASSDLDFDSLVASSSPSLAAGSAGKGISPGVGDSHVAADGSGTLEIDLSNLGSGSLAVGSVAGLSGPSPGAALSGALDSGLSLEGSDLRASGIDLGGSAIGGGLGSAIGSAVGSGIGSGVDAIGGALGGDAFDLGDAATDDDSASVVISTEDGGDSSFFGTVTDDSSSISIGDSTGMSSPLGGGDEFLERAGGPPFSVPQIVGLVCCTLFLLTCSLVMVDLVWSIQSPSGVPISSPLLKALTDTFAWR